MSKKSLKISLIISSFIAVVSVILLVNKGSAPVFETVNYMAVAGEGICEMELPEGALYDCTKYDFYYDGDFAEENGDDIKYLGVEKVQKKVKEILPDAVITSYDFKDGFMFNVDTELNKNLLLSDYEGLFMKGDMCGEGFEYYEGDNDIAGRLKDTFTSSPEYLKCKNKALDRARKDAMKTAKLLNTSGFRNSSEYCYVYQIEDDTKIRIFCSVVFDSAK